MTPFEALCSMKAAFITVIILVSAVLLADRFLMPDGTRVFTENSAIPYEKALPTPALRANESEGVGAFNPPHIPPLELLTQGWTVFPAGAFPRQVRLGKALTFQRAEGGPVELPAGSLVYAIGSQGKVLGLALSPDAPAAAAQAFVHDTDLPTQVRASYERWKQGQLENARLAWKRARSPQQAQAAPGKAVDAQGMPLQSRDGSYELLLASMRSGQVTDIKPGNIRRWGSAQAATLDGQPGWIVNVGYETLAFCGPLYAEAQAQISGGRVLRWIYPGSGEPVP